MQQMAVFPFEAHRLCLNSTKKNVFLLMPEVAPKLKEFPLPPSSRPVVEKVNKHLSLGLFRCFSERLLFVNVLSEDGPDNTVFRSAEEAGGDAGVGNSQAPARI